MGNLKPSDVKRADWIIPHLQKIAEDSEQPNLTRDALEACLTKRAFLLISKTGFLIVKPKVRDGKTQLLLWVAWSPAGRPEYTEEDLNFLGRLFEVNELEFWTKRKGFARLGPRLGFEMVGIESGFNVWRKAL
ncbi:hypothetical protein A3765_28525 [Oleiphilus sp. HI0130]|nr:hypothetical protein A3765_28760 [Oleiphilus sp. HI0130]KZZ72498.1 hypothetical protein A3765_28525 [Oleiphilus sp. HI0130]